MRSVRAPDDVAKLTLSELAIPLLGLAKAIWPYVRRVHGERSAGRVPFEGESDFLEKGLGETLGRLCISNVDDVWWRKLLDCIEHKYVAPDFLQKPALLEWLADSHVQADFKALARARIMGADADNPKILSRLRRTYADKTGEHERLANGPIIVTVAILAAGYLASIAPEQKALAGMVQERQRNSEPDSKTPLGRSWPIPPGNSLACRACCEWPISICKFGGPGRGPVLGGTGPCGRGRKPCRR
jgi:hypothetical protein